MRQLGNRDGFTFLAAMTIIVIMGIMLGLTGQAWKTVMQREREKELLFRGGQIKEAIENWYNPNYSVGGTPKRPRVQPLLNLEDLLTNQYSLKPIRFLPHIYGTKLDEKNSRCEPDCPKIKLEEDPITGKKWEIIKCGTQLNVNNPLKPVAPTGTTSAPLATNQPTPVNSPLCSQFPNGIIGVASTSQEQPFKVSFKDTALENITGSAPGGNVATVSGSVTPATVLPATGTTAAGTTAAAGAAGGENTISKYSDLKFVADPKNDHTKLYRAYRESW